MREQGTAVALKDVSDLVTKFFGQCLRRCGEPNEFIKEAALAGLRAVAVNGETYKVL